MTMAEERRRLDHLAWMNQNHAEKNRRFRSLGEDRVVRAAYRMRSCAPEAVDIGGESEETRKLYGLDEKVTGPSGGSVCWPGG
jgi:hypothetical protein